ncbi:MAG TPA: hypothetical protein VF002_04160 [Gaiellaceae bacterium]
MHKFSVRLVIALAAVIFVVPASAALRDQSPAPAAHPHTLHFAGSIASLGSDSLQVQVERTGPRDGELQGKQVSVAIDANTKIVSEGQALSFSDLKQGERIMVLAETNSAQLDQGLVAEKIRVLAASGSSR